MSIVSLTFEHVLALKGAVLSHERDSLSWSSTQM